MCWVSLDGLELRPKTNVMVYIIIHFAPYACFGRLRWDRLSDAVILQCGGLALRLSNVQGPSMRPAGIRFVTIYRDLVATTCCVPNSRWFFVMLQVRCFRMHTLRPVIRSPFGSQVRVARQYRLHSVSERNWRLLYAVRIGSNTR